MFSKTVQDYGNRSADICLVMQAVFLCGNYNLYASYFEGFAVQALEGVVFLGRRIILLLVVRLRVRADDRLVVDGAQVAGQLPQSKGGEDADVALVVGHLATLLVKKEI